MFSISVMNQIHTTRLKSTVVSEIMDLAFCWKKLQIVNKKIKIYGFNIEPCRMPLTMFIQSLKFKFKSVHTNFYMT